MSYPWYETLAKSNEIRQGDFIQNCPIIIPPTNFNYANGGDGPIPIIEELTVKTFDSVVVSQSCDLENDKVEIVLLCPYQTLNDFFLALPQSDRTGKARTSKLNNLKQGNFPGFHLLNKEPTMGLTDYVVVDFRNVYGVNYDFLRDFTLPIPIRLRLLPPYREHLSQAFARFFMRVGLPSDIEGLV